jgi:hypothetical protein
LQPETTYYFVVRTYTPAHGSSLVQKNDLWSEYSDEIVASTDDPCLTVTEIPTIECEALVTFYIDTNGNDWTNNTDWLETNTPCGWYGVSCETGHVTWLDLRSNGLSGSIPFELGNLSNMGYVYLMSNQLSGNIPPEIGTMTNLSVLMLNENELTGTIPTELGNLSNLGILNLSYNGITGNIPHELGNLTNLVFLNLYSTDLSGSIPPEFGNLVNLQKLVLLNNQLTGGIPVELGNLVNLRELWLSQNQLEGSIPSELGNLTNLEKLYLSDNRLSGSIPHQFGNFINLTTLYLHRNAFDGEIPTTITNLSSLVNTNLGYNKLMSSDPTVISFLNSKDPDWASTQTVAPADVQVINSTTSSVEISWTPIPYSGDGGYYEVSYSTNPGGPYTVHGTTADKTASGYTVDGLNPSTLFYFVVKTFTPSHGSQQNDLMSGYSQEVSASTMLPLTTVQASDGTFTGKVQIFWTAVSGATYYEVYRAVSEGGAKTLLGDTALQAWPDKSATPGVTYYYWVKACNVSGCSDFSVSDIGWRAAKKVFRSKANPDGWILERGEFSGKGGTKNNTLTTLHIGDDALDRQYCAIVSFSTSTLPDDAAITSAYLEVKKAGIVGTNPFSTHGTLWAAIRKGHFGTRVGLQGPDFQAPASVLKAAKVLRVGSTAWYKGTIKAGSLKHVNLTGTTQFRLCFVLDDNDDRSADYIKFFSGNVSNKASRPKLTVKYHIP